MNTRRGMYISPRTHISPGKTDFFRQAFHRGGVLRHVLADPSVAACGGGGEAPVSVGHGDGKPVDLRLNREAHAVAELIFHPLNKIA